MSNQIRFKFSTDEILVPMVERILKEGLKGWEVMYGPNIKPRGSYGSLVDVSMGFKAIPHIYREDFGVPMTDDQYKTELERFKDATGEGL